MRGSSRRKSSHSSIMAKRLQRLLSDLPPIHFSIQPSDLVWRYHHYCPKIYGDDAPATTKSWLSMATRRCGGRAHRVPQLCHASMGPHRSPNPYPRNHYLGDSSIAEAAREMPDASHWCLLKPATPARPDPPPTFPSPVFSLRGPKVQLNRVHLGPNCPSSGLMVKHTVYRDISPCSFWYKEISIRHESIMADPFDSKKKSMEFTSIVHCKGKFYAITLQGAVAVMQVNDTRLWIMAVGSIRAVPRSRSRFFTEYLFEMMEEIMLIFLIRYESIEVVDDVEVFRLDSDRLDWVKVEWLRGKTVFLKELRCDWVESAEFGCRDDCVFFTEGKENKWRVYDLKRRSISSVL